MDDDDVIDFHGLLTRASLWPVERVVEPYAWIEHIPFAFWLVGACRPRLAVELGTHSGNSFFALCQAAEKHRTGSRLVAIDTWEGDAHAGAYGEDVFRHVSAHRNARYPAAELLRMTFDEARARFEAGSVDLLHIDGLHTYEAVCHDFENWREALSPRAVVLFHDTAVKRGDFGVWRLWGELRGRYPSFEFPHCNGLGVVGIGKELPDPMLALFRLDATAARDVIDIYQRLGRSLRSWTNEIDALRHRLSAIESSNSWRLASAIERIANVVRGRSSRRTS